MFCVWCLMVSVRSAVLPVYPEENRPLRSTVSNAATSSKNSHAHTPTVNAGSSLAVSDTILQFLSTLRSFPEFGNQPNSRAHEEARSEQNQTRRTDSLAPSELELFLDPAVSNEPVEKDDPGRSAAFTSSADPNPRTHAEKTVSSLLLEFAKSSPSSSIADSRQVRKESKYESADDPSRYRTSHSYSENFVMSQTSIALMFGLSIDEKPTQEKTVGSAQNDNRASARYRQQSPDRWGNAANPNSWGSVASSEGTTGSRRLQILRATFTEAGTYQFG